MAKVYKMTEEVTQEMANSQELHDDERYVQMCASSDLIHHELLGKNIESVKSIDISARKVGTLTIIKDYSIKPQDINAEEAKVFEQIKLFHDIF